jgi:prophage regulatory protein
MPNSTLAAANKARRVKPKSKPIQPGESLGDGVRLLTKAEVIERTNVSFPCLWLWMKAGTFPRGRSVAGKTMWLEHEVTQWILAQPLCQVKGAPKHVAAT